jgi:hypothetical protein
MLYRLAADAVVVAHLLFTAFVVLGGLLVLRWPRVAFLHLPAAVWGAAIEFGGWICPLTPLEVGLRHAAGGGGYAGGFVEHYLLPLLYPAQFPRASRIMLGTVVIAANLAVYALVAYRLARRRP